MGGVVFQRTTLDPSARIFARTQDSIPDRKYRNPLSQKAVTAVTRFGDLCHTAITRSPMRREWNLSASLKKTRLEGKKYMGGEEGAEIAMIKRRSWINHPLD